MSSSSIEQPTASSDTSAVSWIRGLAAAVVITVAFSILHLAASRFGMLFDSLWFAITGAVFLAVTVAAHRAATWGDATEAEPYGAVGSLFISMAIRLSGTFAILGLLLWFSPLERREAVFNVLFWYITLTVTDVIAVVRQRRRLENQTAVGRLSVPGGVKSGRPRLPAAMDDLSEKLEK